MELEDMDKAYAKNKHALDKSGKLMSAVKVLEIEVKKTKRQIEDISIQILRAKEDGDQAKVKTLEEARKPIHEQLRDYQKKLANLQDIVTKNQTAIDVQMATLSNDPALKAHLDEVIGKKFSRKLAKCQKDKEERTTQNQTLMQIRDAAQKNPDIMYSLKEIEKHTKTIESLQAKIADPSIPDIDKVGAKNDLVYTQDNLEKARTDLARLFKGRVSRDVIDKITSYEDLGREIKSNNRYINGLNKQMANYETALENMGYEVPNRNGASSDISDGSGRPTGRPTDLPAENPKWYQFIKRFRNWNARRKAPEVSESEPAPVSEQEKKKFKDSMRYEVVRDYEEKVASDLLKQAKAQNREAADIERDDD